MQLKERNAVFSGELGVPFCAALKIGGVLYEDCENVWWVEISWRHVRECVQSLKNNSHILVAELSLELGQHAELVFP